MNDITKFALGLASSNRKRQILENMVFSSHKEERVEAASNLKDSRIHDEL